MAAIACWPPPAVDTSTFIHDCPVVDIPFHPPASGRMLAAGFGSI